MRKLHSQIWPPPVFPLGFPDPVFLANGFDAVPGLTNESVRWSPHPHQQGPPSNEACFPSSVSSSSSKPTCLMVLLASRAAARACQCWRLLSEKLAQAEGYPQAISYDQSLGLLKACYTSYFHTCLKVPNPSRVQIVEPLTVIRSIGSRCSRWSSKLPPLGPPGLDSLITNLVANEVKFCDGFVDAQSIGQDLEEMASRASSEWLVARHKPKISQKSIQVKRSEWSIWQSCSRILQALREQSQCRLQNEIQNVDHHGYKLWNHLQ